MKLLLIAHLVILSWLSTINSPDNFTIEYLGNMGVAISKNDSVLFVDAFHSFYRADFLPTSPAKLDDILNRRIPYKYSVINLVTHYHRDHFDPAMSSIVLRSHKSMQLLCSRQAKELMDTSDLQVCNRVIGISKNVEQVKVGRISISAVKLYHINHLKAARYAETVNYGYVINWGQATLLHLGDMEPSEENFKRIEKWKGQIDCLFIPLWIATSETSMELVKKYIAPGRIVVLHIDPKETIKLQKSEIPTTVFSRYNDSFVL